MGATHAEIAEYWSRRQDESGLSVDWAEAQELCWRCAHKRKLERCHVVPRSLGGSDHPSNLVLLCAQCHVEAPNVVDASFMWVWLRAHAVSFYGTYWQERGWREYEFLYGRKPFEGIMDAQGLLPRLRAALRSRMKQVSTHWGQGQLNAATVAWLLRQMELEISAGDEHAERTLGAAAMADTQRRGARHLHLQQRGDMVMDYEEEKVDRAVLALLYLTLHDKYRAWKSFDWGAMNRLYEKGYISDPVNKSKSVILTDDGLAESKRLFQELFGRE